MNKNKNINNKVVNQKSVDFLENYLNNPSPTGFEWEGQRIWLDYLNQYVDETYTDTYGTAVGVINPEAKYKVVLEAHADEISWFVNYINNEGLIYVIRNGGSDHQIAPSKRVNIHTDQGIRKAVFGWPAIHTRSGKEKEENPNLKNIFLDCGCTTKEEVEALGIHVGSVITYEDEFMILNDRYYVGRALDNRIGGFMIAQVARLLKENKKTLPFGLYIVNSVQEEIGLKGAEMIAERIKPNVAIVTDVTHDTQTPMIEKNVQGYLACGKGPGVSYAPAVQINLNRLIVDTAKEKHIPFQRQASSRSTGTDTDAFAYSNMGVASALVSLPLRYMHTTVEMAHIEDVDNAIRLLYEVINALEADQDYRSFAK